MAREELQSREAARHWRQRCRSAAQVLAGTCTRAQAAQAALERLPYLPVVVCHALDESVRAAVDVPAPPHALKVGVRGAARAWRAVREPLESRYRSERAARCTCRPRRRRRGSGVPAGRCREPLDSRSEGFWNDVRGPLEGRWRAVGEPLESHLPCRTGSRVPSRRCSRKGSALRLKRLVTAGWLGNDFALNCNNEQTLAVGGW